jgi:hypothetical protein
MKLFPALCAIVLLLSAGGCDKKPQAVELLQKTG